MIAKSNPVVKSNLTSLIPEFPDQSGVYLMKNARNKIIYIGKAKSLKNRIRSYFNTTKDLKTRHLQSRIYDIETIITKNECEALLLENNLIKRWKPKYNINLKDGKTYPVIKLTTEDYPRVFRTRTITFDGSKYYGPFPRVNRIDLYLNLVDQLFPLRKCRGKLKLKPNPCLNYHINRCSAPCCGKISGKDYLEQVEKVRLLLSGKTERLVRELDAAMQQASGNLDFEKAGKHRDLIRAIEELAAEQKVVDFIGEDRDYIGFSSKNHLAGGVILQMRGGKLVGRETFLFEDYSPDSELLLNFLTGYYSNIEKLPGIIYLPKKIDSKLYTEFLTRLTGIKIKILYPQKGRNARLVAMAQGTAVEKLSSSENNRPQLLKALRESLHLPAVPNKIEGFDIAHLEGRDTVASMVTFLHGLPLKSGYRQFKIRSLKGRIDDYQAIKEVIARRYSRLLNENQQKPDLILIDGGRGQLNAALSILSALGLSSIPVAGLAKREEQIFLPQNPEPLILEPSSPALRLLQRVRDESHRFATTRHRSMRDKKINTGLVRKLWYKGSKI
ncbi:UvrABC system protein C [subsurface metagenome]